jgi:hypothetical protein
MLREQGTYRLLARHRIYSAITEDQSIHNFKGIWQFLFRKQEERLRNNRKQRIVLKPSNQRQSEAGELAR